MEELDVLLKYNINFEEAYNKKKIMQLDEIKIPVASNREKDLTDINALKEIQKLQKDNNINE